MPRKAEIPFEAKLIIWELAVAVGNKPEVIWKQLDARLERLRTEDGITCGDCPDPRTIKRVIEKDINQLPREFVIEKLPRYMWRLRADCEDLPGTHDRVESGQHVTISET